MANYPGLSIYESDARAAAARWGVPWSIFAGLVSQESAWDANQIGSAGEIGLTQLKASTAADLGVNPYLPSDNLNGGAKYLRQQFDTFGNWRDALGAFNQGAAGYRGNGPAGELGTSRGQSYAESVLGKSTQFGSTDDDTFATDSGARRRVLTVTRTAPSVEGGGGGVANSGASATTVAGDASGSLAALSGPLSGIGNALQPIGEFFKALSSAFTGEFWTAAWAWLRDKLLIIAIILLAIVLLWSGAGRTINAGV